MKIKCPFCRLKIESLQLRFHLQKHDTFFTINRYASLLVKIHEKIEYNKYVIDYLQNKDTVYTSPLRRHEGILQELTSLLENDKK